MNRQSEEMRRELDQIFEAFPYIRKEDIPAIDLYMDQVTTFLQRNLSGLSRDPDGDKFLTKTMINNYVKNKVLIPPVKKKYSRDHLMLLIMIYYLKSFLSIGDIRSAITPVMERYASPPDDPAERKKEAQTKKKERAERTASREERQQRAEKGNRKPAEQHADPAGAGQGLGKIYDRVIGEIFEGLPGIRKERKTGPCCSAFPSSADSARRSTCGNCLLKNCWTAENDEHLSGRGRRQKNCC